MVDDLTEKIQAAQSKFEQLVSKIPGYKGYKQREQRREADKLLRMYVASKYQEQLDRLNEIQYTLTSQGRLKVMVILERAVMKLQLLIDRIKTASYGYAGLFDAVKVDEELLDRLYDFDQDMLSGAEELSAKLDRLGEAANDESLGVEDANELVKDLESLNGRFSQRQDVFLE